MRAIRNSTMAGVVAMTTSCSTPLPHESPSPPPIEGPRVPAKEYQENAQRFMEDAPAIITQVLKPEHYQNGVEIIAGSFSRDENNAVHYSTLATVESIVYDMYQAELSPAGQRMRQTTRIAASQIPGALVLLKGERGDNVFFVSTIYQKDGKLSGYNIEYSEETQEIDRTNIFLDPQIKGFLHDMEIPGIPGSVDEDKVIKTAAAFFEYFFIDPPTGAFRRLLAVRQGNATYPYRAIVSAIAINLQGVSVLDFDSERYFSYQFREAPSPPI